jgi:hypothetical protein
MPPTSKPQRKRERKHQTKDDILAAKISELNEEIARLKRE